MINIMKSMHTVHYDAAIRRSEALTRATARMHPEDTLLSEGETTTEEHAVCDPTDRELPGQAGPQTGSSFVVTRGWRKVTMKNYCSMGTYFQLCKNKF